MARRTAKQRQKEKKIATVLAGVLVAAIVAAAMLASPGFALWVQQALGISEGLGPPQTPPDLTVAVHVIDVGQGDATLLYADGEYALIDAGTPESAYTLVAYLRKAGVQSLRYVFMTHPHADHIGGMQAVVEGFDVQNMILPDLALAPYPTTSLFIGLLESMEARGTPTQTVQPGATYPLGTGGVTVLHTGLATQDNYNLLSPGLLFEAGGLRVLATGDGEKDNEAAMLASGVSLAADVFLAGHHGSSTSNRDDFIQAVGPRVVAISCAAGNSYGHPHAAPLKSFDNIGALVLRTDKDGSIVLWPGADGTPQYAVAKLRG